MNGAESLVRTLVAGGVEVCFTNPGTSEMHFVAALDKVDGMCCASLRALRRVPLMAMRAW
jgi:acetolactate synthase I/II/III large subunit